MAAQPHTRAQMKRISKDLDYIAQLKNGKDFRTNTELRQIMLTYGLVEHRISPYEALQRAIDDATLDYIFLRKLVDRESDGPSDIFDHPKYRQMLEARETMVRYSTYAIQYDIVSRQQTITETRVAMLGHALRLTLQKLGLSPEKIQEAPALLIENLHDADKKLDVNRATALVEILHEDAEVVVSD